LYWRSPESGDLWYKLRRLTKTLCSFFKQEVTAEEVLIPARDGRKIVDL